ncbi:methyltransferase domain-containing protein [Scytonema sp. UIC 10036]|uniref:class I SAM-dependent methyltransferase n=1 Tax=Scytonema sp. UIC 10036 TaxID=2304196 RepID=UPI0012DA2B4A|nr:class I SAM-dependent methyltransferase [Scytonema sp. UIC 10036]MUG99540.1 methyltransferase domain-containing protein [Scytonema sp. UIC 10036]
MLQNQWDTSLYEGKHAFVWKYGEELLQLLSAQPEEHILDVGCGTGQLTAKIADAGAIVMGIDADVMMVEKARQNYPQLKFLVADARDFQVNEPFDAVFSNATLHWIPEANAVIRCIYQALKPGGRFVAEFGGKGNIQAIAEAVYDVVRNIGLQSPEHLNPWYFPSISEYATCLEQQGFEVRYAVLFDRPTTLEDGDAGLANWIRMFGERFLSGLSVEQQSRVIHAVEQRLKPVLYQNGIWRADYRRIRVVAVKNDMSI